MGSNGLECASIVADVGFGRQSQLIVEGQVVLRKHLALDLLDLYSHLQVNQLMIGFMVWLDLVLEELVVVFMLHLTYILKLVDL